MLNVVLFGPPGAGKGTQSKKIIEKYKLVHISTGEILRREIAQNTAIGIEASRQIDKGYYVSDEMAIQIIKNEIEKHKKAEGFIFDGFPRTIYQADELNTMLNAMGSKLNVMILLHVEENILIERLLKRAEESGRLDDQSEEIIKKRLKIYTERTEILKEYYKLAGKQESVYGIGKIDIIFEKICDIIERYR